MKLQENVLIQPWRKGILVGCLFLVAVTGLAQTKEQMPSATTSTITSGRDKQGNPTVTTINRRFNHTQVLPTQNLESPQNFWLVLLEEFRSEWSPAREGKLGTVKVEGWAGKFPHARRKAWTIVSEGDEGAIQGNFYRMTKLGCCGALPTQIWFSLIDGQKVFTSTTDLVQVGVPNGSAELTRFIAWHASNASLIPTEADTQKNLQGVLQYSSSRKTLRRLLVRAETDLFLTKVAIQYQGKLHDNKEELANGLMLWGVDGQKERSALSGFALKLTWNDELEAEIPVENDELQLNKAKVPAQIRLEFAK
jgi:hypothetical protein